MGDDERIEAAVENQAGDTLSLQRGCPEPIGALSRNAGHFRRDYLPLTVIVGSEGTHLSDPTITLGSFRSREESRLDLDGGIREVL